MVQWITAKAPVGYDEAVATMEARVAAIRSGEAGEAVWLLEHPPLYTAGSSAKAGDLLDARFPVHRSGRGGQYTYHGPGQRVAYVMLDLMRRGGEAGPDLRAYVQALEEWVITALRHLGVEGERRPGRVGIWVAAAGGEAKIAAIGVRVRRGVSYHGVAINVSPDLSHYDGIVPCGLPGFGVTSLAALGAAVSPEKLDRTLKEAFVQAFPS